MERRAAVSLLHDAFEKMRRIGHLWVFILVAFLFSPGCVPRNSPSASKPSASIEGRVRFGAERDEDIGFKARLKYASAEVQGGAAKPQFIPSVPGIKVPGAPASPPRIAPSSRPSFPIRLPAPSAPAPREPLPEVTRRIILPIPFWAIVALLVLLPSTAQAPERAMDCASSLSHKNDHLAGKKHPVTGVEFNELGYPIFDSIIDMTLPDELRGPNVSDVRQFTEATRQLGEVIEISPALGALFTPEQLKAIREGEPRIPGLTWHHHEDGFTLQLVDRDVHAKTGHSGGRENSGGRPD